MYSLIITVVRWVEPPAAVQSRQMLKRS